MSKSASASSIPRFHNDGAAYPEPPAYLKGDRVRVAGFTHHGIGKLRRDATRRHAIIDWPNGLWSRVPVALLVPASIEDRAGQFGSARSVQGAAQPVSVGPDRSDGTANPAPPPQSRGEPSRRKPPMVLVVDDEPPIIRVMRRMLNTRGWVVIDASSPIDARDLMVAARPDVILTDWEMPSGGGARVLLDAAAEGIPCVVCSGTPPTDIPVRVIEKTATLDEIDTALRESMEGAA